MQDFTNTKIHIDKVCFMNGAAMQNVDAYISYNFLILPGRTEDTTNWINLRSISRMEGTRVINEEE